MEEIIKNRAIANRMLLLEATLVAFCGGALYLFVSPVSAYSLVLGGLAFILPNLVFVRFSLRTSVKGSTALAWFYVGEAMKIVLTIIIFWAAFVFVKPLNIGLMFVSFGCVLLVNLTGLAILMNKNN